MATYHVSYTMTADDNGSCNSFDNQKAAMAAYRELIRDGCRSASLWSGSHTLYEYHEETEQELVAGWTVTLPSPHGMSDAEIATVEAHLSAWIIGADAIRRATAMHKAGDKEACDSWQAHGEKRLATIGL